MSEASPGRRRIWWLALVLNLVFPPAGYGYVGAWRIAAGFSAGVIVAAVVLTELTIAFPPGIYGLGLAGVLVLGLSLAVALGVHAAWLAEGSAAKTGSRLLHAATYGLAFLVTLAATQAFRAYWPHAFYSYSSASMEPTVREGDILAVKGSRAVCAGRAPPPGDVALYHRPGSQTAYMHRVVAGPGQTVSMKAGQLFVDGAPTLREGVGEQAIEFARRPATVVEETLPGGARFRTLDAGPGAAFDDVAPTRLPAEAVYVLGDNRDNSADSRVNGPVAARDVCGVAFRIIASRETRHVGRKP